MLLVFFDREDQNISNVYAICKLLCCEHGSVSFEFVFRVKIFRLR